MSRALANLCRRLHITWLLARHNQLMLAAAQLARDDTPHTPLHLASCMAHAAAIACQIAAIEQRILRSSHGHHA